MTGKRGRIKIGRKESTHTEHTHLQASFTNVSLAKCVLKTAIMLSGTNSFANLARLFSKNRNTVIHQDRMSEIFGNDGDCDRGSEESKQRMAK